MGKGLGGGGIYYIASEIGNTYSLSIQADMLILQTSLDITEIDLVLNKKLLNNIVTTQ